MVKMVKIPLNLKTFFNLLRRYKIEREFYTLGVITMDTTHNMSKNSNMSNSYRKATTKKEFKGIRKNARHQYRFLQSN